MHKATRRLAIFCVDSYRERTGRKLKLAEFWGLVAQTEANLQALGFAVGAAAGLACIIPSATFYMGLVH